jgi:hypothetical protein
VLSVPAGHDGGTQEYAGRITTDEDSGIGHRSVRNRSATRRRRPRQAEQPRVNAGTTTRTESKLAEGDTGVRAREAKHEVPDLFVDRRSTWAGHLPA